MDIQEYILMCGKADEIQENFPKNPNIGDSVYMKGYEFPSTIVNLDEYYNDETWKVKLDDDFAYEDTRDLVWLPKQDQLQGMLKDKFKLRGGMDLYHIIKCFQIFQVKHTAGSGFTSMEQLWLAFVMKEKFNKIWNREEWILQNQ